MSDEKRPGNGLRYYAIGMPITMILLGLVVMVIAAIEKPKIFIIMLLYIVGFATVPYLLGKSSYILHDRWLKHGTED